MKKIAALLILFGASLPAWATDGYFSHGYGMTAKGMGGASAAMASDSFGGANNPASMAWIGNRLDVGLDWFSPKRDSGRAGGNTGMNGHVDSDSTNFFIPEFGYNRVFSPTMSLGLSVYGNGGMNTDYPGGQLAANPCAGMSGPAASYNLLCGTGKLGVDLSQLVIAPTLALKLNAGNSIGVAPLFGYQRFKIDGVQPFAGFTPSQSTNYLTNKGYDSSTGWGLRLGWQGRLNEAVTLGAAYSTKIKMGNFDKYKELFAGGGAFDIPVNFSLGAAFKATPNLTVALDYERIDYSGVASVGNPSSNRAPLGAANGPGFGWQDVDVIKLGVQYQYAPNLLLRAGYNHSSNPIQSRDVTFNILAPGVVQDHITLGFSYALSRDSDLTMAYMHANSNSVSGASMFTGIFQSMGMTGANAGTETIRLNENSLGVAYGLKLK